MDRAAALDMASYSFGSVIGPIIGGKLYDAHGYQQMTEFCCLTSILAALIYFIIVILPDLVTPAQNLQSPI
jgi:predicted MFS family arabinose efflux permease